MNRLELRSQIIQALVEDEAFKKAFTSNSKAAIKEKFGVELPEQIEIRTVEEGVNSITVIVPNSTNELSDSELDSIAGGDTCIVHVPSCTVKDICPFKG